MPLEGELFDLLSGVYEKSEAECDIEISFNSNAEGVADNPCRTLLLSHLRKPDQDTARSIAERLESFTTKRSKLGLLFIVYGQEGEERKIVISRFPADNAILAEERDSELSVEFLKQVFMKSIYSYKAVVYRDTSIDNGFWLGRAVDKQIGNPMMRASDYWIREFLDSDFRTTAAAGTRNLAIAISSATKSSADLAVKRELTAAGVLAQNLDGQQTSIAEFQDRLGLSDASREVMGRYLKSSATAAQRFLFDANEFGKHVVYKSVGLDTGAVLTAEAGDFDELFVSEIVDGGDQIVRFTTEGI